MKRGTLTLQLDVTHTGCPCPADVAGARSTDMCRATEKLLRDMYGFKAITVSIADYALTPDPEPRYIVERDPVMSERSMVRDRQTNLAAALGLSHEQAEAVAKALNDLEAS